jgi:hypothetical protein
LQDVYGYDGVVINPKTGEAEDPKVRIKDRFHNQCATLRGLVEEACVEVGLPYVPNIFCQQNRNKTSYWRLSDEVRIEDLTSLQQCRLLLAEDANKKADPAQVRAACERTCSLVGENLSALLDADETHEPWIRRMVKDALGTYYKALKYLALSAQAEAEQTTDEETRRRHCQKEMQHWTRYALSCAQMAGSLFEDQQTLISNGEMALQKTLFRCIRLSDPERAATVYQEFKGLVENNGDVWEPEAKTKKLWQKVLTLDEDDAA